MFFTFDKVIPVLFGQAVQPRRIILSNENHAIENPKLLTTEEDDLQIQDENTERIRRELLKGVRYARISLDGANPVVKASGRCEILKGEK
jgi:hypothetical protein